MSEGQDARVEDVTLPLPLRNRLAELILDAFHDRRAREGLEALAAVCADPGAPAGMTGLPEGFPHELFERRAGAFRLKGGWTPYAAELGERSGRAWRALRDRPLDPPDAPLSVALAEAGLLFDAGLYFEVHEQLEPHWMRTQGSDREALQGLIQIAVGFQHLANGNIEGARALLHDGAAKLLERRLAGLPLDGFARAVSRCLDLVLTLGTEAPRRFDWATVPRFPEPG